MVHVELRKPQAINPSSIGYILYNSSKPRLISRLSFYSPSCQQVLGRIVFNCALWSDYLLNKEVLTCLISIKHTREKMHVHVHFVHVSTEKSNLQKYLNKKFVALNNLHKAKINFCVLRQTLVPNSKCLNLIDVE